MKVGVTTLQMYTLYGGVMEYSLSGMPCEHQLDMTYHVINEGMSALVKHAYRH